MIAVYLNSLDLGLAERSARKRQSDSRNRGIDDLWYSSHNRSHYECDLMGALGEIALAKYLGIGNFEPSVGTFHKVPDLPGGIEVRASSHSNGKLILRSNDRHPQPRKFVLVLIPHLRVPIAANLMGWMWGPHGMDEKYLSAPNREKKCWMVPVSDLNPISYLPTHRIELDASWEKFLSASALPRPLAASALEHPS